MTLLEQAYIIKVLDYDPSTGVLTWRERSVNDFGGNVSTYSAWTAKNAGRRAGNVDKLDGYRRLGLVGRLHKAQRVIWMREHGWLPPQVDHENGDRDDNRLANLRASNSILNGRNQKKHVTDTSGVAGVSWNRKMGKWGAYIGDGERPKWLGGFDLFQDAVAARQQAELEYGYSALHGRRL